MPASSAAASPGSGQRSSSTRQRRPIVDDAEGIYPVANNSAIVDEDEEDTAHEAGLTLGSSSLSAHTLLKNYDRRPSSCGEADCPHGIYSPKGRESPAPSVVGSVDSTNGQGGRYPGETINEDNGWNWYWSKLSDALPFGKKKPYSSTSSWLASTHGVKHRRYMYLGYYFPFLKWVTQYHWSYLQGDAAAAITMASFYIPMALSYSSNLAHLPPINGLYSFAVNPFIYGFLGTCPQMVVGPEAAGSLLLGNVVRSSIENGNAGEDDANLNSRIAGVVTAMSGLIIFIGGLMRLGFLDSVLSRPFLRGFISAIGFVIIADQLLPETGLLEASKNAHMSHGSSFEKLEFIFTHLSQAHALTCWVSFVSFFIIMFCRELKKRMQPRRPWVAYIPDRFIVVVFSAVLTYAFRWDKQGLDILGEVKSATGAPFSLQFPIIPSHMKHVREALSTSFIIALLGFFESTVAAKSLPDGEQSGLKGMSHSANRELVALGTANMVGGCFMALPAFGGYGRSKVNSSTGGKTPMSSILLSMITIICVYALLPYFYYLPKGVLSAMVSVVAYSLIEECPHDIKFFFKIRGWYELGLMFLIFMSAFFYSLELGIGLGLLFSIATVIKHSTQSRIQILGRVPGSADRFENAEDDPQAVEFIEGCLIVKIPEPLTFANTGELKSRLRRLERYGTVTAHPALPAVRDDSNNRNIIFDIHGVTTIDGSGTQVLVEIVEEHLERGSRVFFCRVPSRRSQMWRQLVSSGIVEMCGGEQNFTQGVKEALDLAEKDEGYRDEPDDRLV